jgi:DNA-binding LacI/PurR family transcriptional regulator
MDDITADTYFDVPLSSIHFEYESVCEEICDLIFSRIENRYCRTKEKIVVPARVNIRESLRSFDKQNA